MSQHDYDISTADANTGVTMRAAINAALQALAGNNSGATEPATKYPYMWWADTTSGYLKQRNAANTAWITVMLLATALMSDSDKCDGFHASQTPAANQIPVLNSAGRLVLGGTDDGISKAQVGGPLAVRSGKNSLVVGADAAATTLTDSTVKYGRISAPHYLTNEEPAMVAFMNCGNASNTLSMGGGSSALNAATDITLYTAENYNTTTGTPRVRVLPSGRILAGPTLPTDDGVNAFQVNGTIASKGVKLDGTASSDVNTLDYYEEGTFTPVLYGLTTDGEGTYTSQTGKYTRIGNTVNIVIYLTWSAHTGTGGMRISGLPFASAGHVSFSNYHVNLSVGSGKVLGTYTASGTQYVQLMAMDPAGTATSIPMDTAASILLISGTYFV
jgi:hypothetical protein